jgi:hypothetical protein
MKSKLSVFVTLVFLAMGVQSQSARADDFWGSLFGHQDPRLTASGIVVGAGATAGYFALRRHHGYKVPFLEHHVQPALAYGLTTFACMVVYPMVGTIAVNRPLTPREAYVGMGNCILPFIGGWIVDAALPHDAWTDGGPVSRPRRHHHHHG